MKKKITSLLTVCAMLVSLVPTAVLGASREANPDMSDWFPYEVAKASEIEGTILDSSDILEKPSGKHGFLNRTEGEDMFFEDGTEARFWGVNVTGASCFPTYEIAEESAKRIAQSGFNLVRLHLIDIGNFWGPKALGGRVIKKDALDRLCYFIAQLKKNGIYLYIDLMSPTPNTSDLNEVFELENMGNVARYESYLSEDLKNETKKYAKTLLETYNEYTGFALKDDPSIVMIDIKNECSIAGVSSIADNRYVRDVRKRYNEWLREKYGNTENLRAAWYADRAHNPQIAPLDEDENLEEGTVKIFDGKTTLGQRRKHREADEYKFRMILFNEFYDDFIPYLKNEVGVKCLVSSVTGGSEGAIDLLTCYGNRDKDFSDFHMYTAMPTTNVYEDGTSRDTAVKSLLETGGNTLTPTGLISSISKMYVYGLPHTISEWNDVAPNKYRAEMLLMMGAYTSLHSSHPAIFAWKDTANDDSITTDTLTKATFGAADTPEYMAAFPAISRTVLRGDVSEAEAFFPNFRYQDDELYTTQNQYLKKTPNYGAYLGYIGKTGMIFEEDYSEDVCDDRVLRLAYDAYNGDKNFVSVTGEISMNYSDKMFRLNTPKTQAISGFTSERPVELDDVKFEIDNYYATAYLNSVDDEPLCGSKEMLLTLVGDTRNTGQVMSEDEQTIITAGTGPVLVEPITGTVTIKSSVPIAVTAINTKGQPIKKIIRPTKTEDGYSFKLEASTKAMHYKITRGTAGRKNEHISLGNTELSDMFEDVKSADSKKKEIERVAAEGFMSARAGNCFMPDAPVTRKEFLNALVYGMYMDDDIWVGSSDEYSYGDLKYDEDGFKGVAAACNANLISSKTVDGIEKCVEPNKLVTREEALVWTAKFITMEKYPTMRTKRPDVSFGLSRYSDAASAGENSEYFRYTLGMGYMSDKNGAIAASDYMTRRETAELIYKLIWQ